MGPRDSLDLLLARFDPGVMDLDARGARVRLRVSEGEAWDAVLERDRARLEQPISSRPDAMLRADERTWRAIGEDVRGGMDAFAAGRLMVRGNLHVAVGLLAATSGLDEPGRLVFRRLPTARGTISMLAAGQGEPVVMIHGLGGTKASMLPTVAALAGDRRAVAIDLPGFGDSAKPFPAPYDAPYLARAVLAALDALEIERADLVGNSLGGRVAIEAGLLAPERVRRLALLAPALAWLRARPWARALRLVRPELGAIQPTWGAEALVRRLVPGAREGWSAAGVDEFLRAYRTPRGRAAFYAAARHIYLDDPAAFWERLGSLGAPALFVWGRHDGLVPVRFRPYVERALPAARHLVLDCGHVPQLESPRETHAAVARFLGAG